jgi:hypothetical protein
MPNANEHHDGDEQTPAHKRMAYWRREHRRLHPSLLPIFIYVHLTHLTQFLFIATVP